MKDSNRIIGAVPLMITLLVGSIVVIAASSSTFTTTTPPSSFVIQGWVNAGAPVSNPNVTIKNLNTSEVFAVESKSIQITTKR